MLCDEFMYNSTGKFNHYTPLDKCYKIQLQCRLGMIAVALIPKEIFLMHEKSL